MTGQQKAPLRAVEVPHQKILNFDENALARDAKSRALIEAGFLVFSTGTADEALALAAAHHPDLVLLESPSISAAGAELCGRLKTSPTTAGVLVLQISPSKLNSKLAPSGSSLLKPENCPDSHLTAPVDEGILLANVRCLLRLRDAERSLSSSDDRLKSTGRDLLRCQDDLAHFAFLASHDLQEPLRTVTSFVGLLDRSARKRLTDSERQYMDFIVEGAQRTRELIEDLLAYLRVGAAPEAGETTDLAQILAWVMEDLELEIKEAGADIEVACKLPTVAGDTLQLEQLLRNLLTNALDSRSEKRSPVILIDCHPANDHEWLITVRDNGIGIDSRLHGFVFQPFKRVRDKSPTGTATRLAICRRIVEGHAGRIWIESTVEGGSTFFLTLPSPVNVAAPLSAGRIV